MKRLWAYLFAPKVFGCGCGKSFRTETELGAHAWKHAVAL